MASGLKNLMTMQHACQDLSPTPIVAPQRSTRIKEIAEEETQAEVTGPGNHEEALSLEEVVVVAVAAEVRCPGFETASVGIDEMTRIHFFLSQY
jgi:hypothetical protein